MRGVKPADPIRRGEGGEEPRRERAEVEAVVHVSHVSTLVSTESSKYHLSSWLLGDKFLISKG